jgi:hypothetical protein
MASLMPNPKGLRSAKIDAELDDEIERLAAIYDVPKGVALKGFLRFATRRHEAAMQEFLDDGMARAREAQVIQAKATELPAVRDGALRPKL